ncbi:MAG: HIT family protein [Candidatus Heimdallarchaeaceae archaeon]
MSNECLFCKIINGEISSYTLYEDEEVKVFLDIYPVSYGHSLLVPLVPKEHFSNIYEIPENKMNFLEKLPKIAKRLKKITKATGLNIIQSNGKDAGQVIEHVHFHLIPRFPEDGIIKFPKQHELKEEDAKKLVEEFK